MAHALANALPLLAHHALALALVAIGLAVLALMVHAMCHPRPVAAPAAPLAAGDDLLVLHASQTGNARALAVDTGELLRLAGRVVHVRSLGSATAQDLLAHRCVLLVAATTGDGDAPDEAQAFVRDVMRARALPRRALARLRFGLLALGDSHYSDFCGFGQRLDAWLRSRGARPLFERIEVDGWDNEAVLRWHAALDALVGPPGLARATVDAPAGTARPWRIAARRVLNEGSLGETMAQVELEPADGSALPHWEAGDLARLLVPGQYRPRDYSIASLPTDGRVHLVVRRVRLRGGTPGAGSGWLLDAPAGSQAPLLLVAHPSFRLGDNADRPLVFIANGAGIAGVRAHLRARADRPGARHWLVFGERQRAHDFLFADEIASWQRDGLLERLDLAFSRDQAERIHVQHRLLEAAQELRRWVDAGAAIYVCGSRTGMGEGVHDALIDALGADTLQALAAAGRYRRDVY